MLKPPRYRMTPVSAKEYALIFSPLPITGVALMLLTMPSVDDASKRILAVVLDHLCAQSVPTFWCRVPRPISSLAVVQAFNYLAFLFASLYFILWIFVCNYSRPSNYVPGSAPRLHQWGWALWWLFIIVGGQLLPQRTPPWSAGGLLFTVLALSTGLGFIRFLAVSLKFQR